jgi:hypothetical protein
MGAASAVALSALLLFVAASPATGANERRFKLKGPTTVTDSCNSGSFVKFIVVTRGDFVRVEDFSTYNINFPNIVPFGTTTYIPAPQGVPGPDCAPALTDGWTLWDWDPAAGIGGGNGTYITFGSEDFSNNEFFGAHAPASAAGYVFDARTVYGKVNIKKKKPTNKAPQSKGQKFIVKARGYYIQAQGEAGLDFGGRSSGNVGWRASNQR